MQTIFTVSSLMKIHSRIIWQKTAGMSLDSNEVIAHFNLSLRVIEEFYNCFPYSMSLLCVPHLCCLLPDFFTVTTTCS